MTLEESQSPEDKKKWQLVRTDSCDTIVGEIIFANEDTGECAVTVGGEKKTLSLGAGGLRIIRAR